LKGQTLQCHFGLSIAPYTVISSSGLEINGKTSSITKKKKRIISQVEKTPSEVLYLDAGLIISNKGVVKKAMM
jgi:hypothetical protein